MLWRTCSGRMREGQKTGETRRSHPKAYAKLTKMLDYLNQDGLSQNGYGKEGAGKRR